MSVPGSNLLNQALRIIAKQTVTYYPYTGRSNNDIGLLVPTFGTPVQAVGSFQPLPKEKYQVFGLDYAKSYFVFYVSRNVLDLTRDVSGDQLAFQGRRYQCESKVPWYGIDGWDGVLCVDIKNA